jgi:hypothetical protein
MKRLVLFAVVLGVLSIISQVSDAANLEDQYLCVVDKRIDFGYDYQREGSVPATLQAGKNFLISLSSSHDIVVRFLIIEAGNSRPSGYCRYGFNDYGVLFCDVGSADFKFNKYNGRYITTHAGRYDDFPRGAYMETGKCSSLR